ncbi:hypothetical protein F5X71_27880 [Nocardia brasiliensis]|uniref:Uncharacterized protein n=1 Tax=Nocardia brasiliensis TaxID=37326 RepID=A0A6G9XXI7_NOCBR|nr:hypothetical protein [Nocardia brasiliensis]QIS05621.1 hypothetical protein F5X71_27880 [Nocardia brasiliensis]
MTVPQHPMDRAVAARFESLLPLGAPTVNIVGSALLGGLVGAGAGDWLPAAADVRGALITFSTSLVAVFAVASTRQWLWT